MSAASAGARPGPRTAVDWCRSPMQRRPDAAPRRSVRRVPPAARELASCLQSHARAADSSTTDDARAMPVHAPFGNALGLFERCSLASYSFLCWP